jgi:hypothetical protein
MNTPYIMVCVEKPKTSNERTDQDWPRWHILLEQSTKLLLVPGLKIEQPIENIWLIPVNESLLLASKFLELCSASGLAYKVFWMESHPSLCS